MIPRLSSMLAALLAVTGCAPKALYFHETTKVAFAADYNTSDTQPLATSLGYKRRIVAVVPAQERRVPHGGTERNGTNEGEALSLVSKFNIQIGAREGTVITNNFASGMAARILTQSAGSEEALNVMMHAAPISVNRAGQTESGKPASEVVNERLARIMGKRTTVVPLSRRSVDSRPDGGITIKERSDTEARKSERTSTQSSREVDFNDRGEPIIRPRSNGNSQQGSPVRKPDIPASSRSVDLAPDGEAVIRKRK